MEIGEIKLLDILEFHNSNALDIYLKYIDECLADTLIKRKITVFKQIKEAIKDGRNLEELGQYTLYDLQTIVDAVNYDYTSESILSGHRVILYPKIIEKISRNEKVCSFSGCKIRKGNYYIHYKFLLDDLDGKKRYALANNINIQREYDYLLPKTIRELEEFNRKLESSYENDDELFYNISSNLKSEGLKIKKLY